MLLAETGLTQVELSRVWAAELRRIESGFGIGERRGFVLRPASEYR